MGRKRRSRYGLQRYACDSCGLDYSRRHKRRRTNRCPQCLSRVVVAKTGPTQRERYLAYINSPEWRELRRLVYERDGGLCRSCERPAENVHHTHYKRFGEEDGTELVSLCRACHQKEHASPLRDSRARWAGLLVAVRPRELSGKRRRGSRGQNATTVGRTRTGSAVRMGEAQGAGVSAAP